MINKKYTARAEQIKTLARHMVNHQPIPKMSPEPLGVVRATARDIIGCKRYDEWCRGCPEVTVHGGCGLGEF